MNSELGNVMLYAPVVHYYVTNIFTLLSSSLHSLKYFILTVRKNVRDHFIILFPRSSCGDDVNQRHSPPDKRINHNFINIFLSSHKSKCVCRMCKTDSTNVYRMKQKIY